MQTSARGELNREPNVIPMIDILLVLLITAILGLLPAWIAQVHLPVPSASGTPVHEATTLVLSVKAGPRYELNQQPIAREDLIPRLTEVFRNRPQKILFIDGARDVRYQDVFYVYGAVRGAGVTVTAIVPPSTARPATSPALP